MKAMHIGAALGAVLFAACAHGATSHTATESYLGGRAGQPYGFVKTGTRPSQVIDRPSNLAYQGGQAAQPYSWLRSSEDTPATTPTYCYQGGRDAQPLSGPPMHVTTVRTDKGDRAVCAYHSAPSRL